MRPTSQTSQGFIVQVYCNSVLQQPPVDFGDQPNLASEQDEINIALSKAQSNAREFNQNILPMMIENVTNIESYFQLHNIVPVVLPEGSSTEDWLAVLKVILEEAKNYEKVAEETESTLIKFVSDLTDDVSAFNSSVENINQVVDEDNSIVEANKQLMDGIQKKIDLALAGAIVSVPAGAILFVLGAFGEVVTGV